METTINWFNYSENSSDMIIIMTFLKDLPGNLKVFVDPKNSTFKEVLNRFDNYGINSNLFDKAFMDATDEFEVNYIMQYSGKNLTMYFNNCVFVKT